MLELVVDHLLDIVTWVVILGGLGFVIATLVGSSRRSKDKEQVEITDLSRDLEEDQFEFLQTMGQIGESASFKYKVKKTGGHLFVLDFIGSVDAAEVDLLRNEITSLLSVINKEQDEILIRLNSGGGVVNGYGLVASQIDRIRKHGVKVTAAVDEVAASGGYMAACVADRIIAAPFAYIGSIGVVSAFPNFSNLLDRFGIQYKEYTAGESKRLISQYREISKKDEAEYKKELEETHESFINHVSKYRKFETRPEGVFTGKHWLASEALELGLVDEIMTSDEYIESFHNNADKGAVFKVSTKVPRDPTRYFDKFFKVAINNISSLIKSRLRF